MLETDLLLDRRRLKRRLLLWRLLAVAAAVVAGIALVGRLGGIGSTGRHVARVNLNGVITDDRKLLQAIGALADDRSVPAVVLTIDSPGGSVGGGEALYGALQRVAARKPLVAVMRGTAASAGYMAALPAARIWARDSTLTGSIGVILQTGEVSGLLDRLGVGAEAITSGPLKDQPSFTRPLTLQGREYLQALVRDMYEQFVEKVATNRHLDPARVRQLGDGRAYTGRQAREAGLIDEIGGEPEARDWLARERGVSKDVPIRDVVVGNLYERAARSALAPIWDAIMPPAVLPGAWSVWQGEAGTGR